MKIRNYGELAATKGRRKVLDVIDAGLQAIDTRAAVRGAVFADGGGIVVCGRRYEMREGSRLVVAGAGKCSLEAVLELEAILGDRISGGVVIDSTEGELPKRVRYFRGDHPYPTEANRAATRELLASLSGLGERDLVILVVSGGGTVMLSQSDSCTAEEEAALVKALFRAGADIADMNMIRKHLSTARGGFLAERAAPASVEALVFSDVIGNDVGTISSGPAVFDHTTVAEALSVVERHKESLGGAFHPSWLIETPKDPAVFEKARNTLVVSNDVALEAMEAKARELGLRPLIVTDTLSGEAREVGEAVARDIASAEPGTCLLYGGETTVKVANPDGKGGRNQEASLGALRAVADGTVLAFVASDGVDNTPVAGAICDTITARRAAELGLAPDAFLGANRSFDFFERAGGHIVTGATGSNVADLAVALRE